MKETLDVNQVKEFARKVEFLCDFLIHDAERDGSDDITVIQDLKDEAADIQFAKSFSALSGLSAHMKGLNQQSRSNDEARSGSGRQDDRP